jgi:hypothetical protein
VIYTVMGWKGTAALGVVSEPTPLKEFSIKPLRARRMKIPTKSLAL